MKNLLLLPLLFTFYLIAACGDKEDEGGGLPTLPKISAEPVSTLEGNATTTLNIVVKLSNAFNKEVSLDYATSSSTAKAGQDFEDTAGSLSFAVGETEKTIPVTLLADFCLEQDEQFEVKLSNPANGSLESTSVVATILNDDVPSSEAGYSTPESYAGYTLVWQDEFNGTAIDLNNWTYDIGRGSNGWGNNELEYYTDRPQNSFISEGKLVIEAKKEDFSGAQYTSARLKTQGLHSFKFGRIDIRAKLPYGKGIWPALWMLGDNITSAGWPKCGEIDIMEIIGSLPATLHGTVHWDNNGSYASYGKSTTLPACTFADEYHVFSIIWNDQSIKWLLDDVQFNVVDITPAALSEFKNNFFFIFNVAVGGNWPGSPDATTIFPQQMKVDYVRVFQEG